jgi:hypothetical protein
MWAETFLLVFLALSRSVCLTVNSCTHLFPFMEGPALPQVDRVVGVAPSGSALVFAATQAVLGM